MEAGAEVELFVIREMNLPMYIPGMDAPPEAVRLSRAACSAQGLIWSSSTCSAARSSAPPG